MLIAIKIGSNVLTRRDGTLDFTRMSALVDQIAELRQRGNEVILISSGAVASGRSEMSMPAAEMDEMGSVEQRQVFSAVGQAKLIGRYVDLFRDHHIHVGQVLTTKDNFLADEPLQNQHQCMAAMLAHGVLPIVNENDTVCITELMFTDNDELSGLIARLMGCQMLIILSNIDGIYTGDPANPASQLITTIRPGDDLSRYIQSERSAFGRGGMASKYATATRVQAAGIPVVIANGKRDDILTSLIDAPATTPHTEFVAE
ncbi:MAG: glutamate 5-kinase [Bacteroidaceae bacterium]|nr:glutamate 5-kinase [Bacteroidaceae bacterium]